MLNHENLLALAKTVAKADSSAPVAYSWNGQSLSYDALNETLRQEFNELAGTYALYRENKNIIFSIIEEVLDDVLPKKVVEQYSDFAEVQTFKQGAGIYEVFKLSAGTESFEVPTSAIGGAAQIGLEEFLDGRVDFAEVLDTVMTGMDELVYKEVAQALKASINQLPANNTAVVNGFDEQAFDTLLTIVSAYGVPTIYCTQEFAVKMIPQQAWRYTEAMKDELWKTGRLAQYKQYKVVILEQGFEDETNSTKVIDPGYCWILPTGADSKPVKIAFEGNTIIDEFQNADRSREVQVYKKVGVVAMLANNICAYVDTSLVGQMKTWNLSGYKTVKDYGKA